MGEKRSQGEEKAWKILKTLRPEDVCINADVVFAPEKQLYTINCLGQDFHVSPQEKTIESLTAEGEIFLHKLSYFFTLSLPWYLISSKNIQPTGNFIRPEDLSGGGIFFKGSHTLPLQGAAKKYGDAKKKFIEKCLLFGGKPLNYGDASFELRPMPRISLALTLWVKDEEFPPRMDLLFDSTCEFHAPLDIIWSLAMMTVLIFLQHN